MKAITLRDVPKPIADKIHEEAKRTGASLNKTVIRMLSQTLTEPPANPQTYHSLDHLFGTWTEEEADEFDAHLAEQRQIDKEMWK